VDRLNLDATQPDQRALRRGLRHLPYATKEEAVAIIQDARASVFVKVQGALACLSVS
jgi:hypothetical protein